MITLLCSGEHRRCCRGFGLFELAVTLCVIGILGTVLLHKMNFYRQQAEDVAVGTTVVNMRTALRVRASQLMGVHDNAGLVHLATSNPIALLASPPRNYLGELEPSIGEELPRGNWFFHRKSGELIYLLNYGNFVAIEGQKSLNFKVKLLVVRKNSSGESAEGIDYMVMLDRLPVEMSSQF